jgi:hypothetical protein
MKTLIKYVFTILIATNISQASFAQGFDNIANAIKSGDAVSLARYFEGNVEIGLKDAQNSYSKSQAEVVLKNFFSTHSPKSFAIAHQGTSPEGSKYFIGNLVTSAGTYRTYVYAKQVGGVFQIQEIRFEDQ